MNPTPQPVQDAITALASGNVMANLYSRWLDEQEYEDIADYGAAFAKQPGVLRVEGCTKRPFGFKIRMEAFPEGLYHVTCNSRQAEWKRLAR